MKRINTHDTNIEVESLAKLLDTVIEEIKVPAVFNHLFSMGLFVEHTPLGLTIHLPDGSSWDRASLDGSDKLQSITFRSPNSALVTETRRIAEVQNQMYTKEHSEKVHLSPHQKHSEILQIIIELIKQFHDQTYKAHYDFHQKLLALIGNT